MFLVFLFPCRSLLTLLLALLLLQQVLAQSESLFDFKRLLDVPSLLSMLALLTTDMGPIRAITTRLLLQQIFALPESLLKFGALCNRVHELEVAVSDETHLMLRAVLLKPL